MHVSGCYDVTLHLFQTELQYFGYGYIRFTFTQIDQLKLWPQQYSQTTCFALCCLMFSVISYYTYAK